MRHEEREYDVHRVGHVLVATTTYKKQTFQVCHVGLRQEHTFGPGARPWTHKFYGLPLAYGLLLHHFSLRWSEKVAKGAASHWRKKFWDMVLTQIITETVHLTDTYLNQWIIDDLLDTMSALYGINAAMRHPAVSRN